MEAQGRTELKAELGRGGADAGLWDGDEDTRPGLGGKVDLGWCGAVLYLYELSLCWWSVLFAHAR